jgi:hypothetical protein
MVALVVATVTGCSSTAAQPPNAASLAAKLGYRLACPGLNFDGEDLKADYDLSGPGTCNEDEVMVFLSASAQSDWLHLDAASNPYGLGPLYSILAVGNLWAMDASNSASPLAIAHKLGGKEVDL